MTTSPPNLVNFELDLNASTISLTFDEAVNLMDFNPTAITLLNDNGTNFTRSYQIQGVRDSEMISNFGTTITFGLTLEDQTQLKAYEDFATDLNDTFLVTTDELITDTNRPPNANRNVPVTLSDPLQVFDVYPDVTPPRLQEFCHL